MKTQELRRLLRKAGCTEVPQSGSHLIVRCPSGCQTTIPIHSRDIAPGTLRNIGHMLEPCLGEDLWR